MKHPLSFLGGFLAGLCAMYYLDAQSGGRRRALVRDQLVSAGHDLADLAQVTSKRALGRAKGMVATGSLDRRTRRPPESDFQLEERIRARLGRTVGHPGAVHVHVEQGCVRLDGHLLRKDLDPLMQEICSMAGVSEVRNELQVHEQAEGVPELQGSTEAPGREPSPGGTAWH